MPRRITIDPMPFLNDVYSKGLVKDLHDTEAYTEEICNHCKGTGLQIADNPYGLKENRIPGHLFPYKVQTLIPCRECSGTGVRKRCNYCGELFPLYRLKCNCDTQKKKDEAEDRRKWQERIDSMRFATDEEIKQCKVFFSDIYPYNEGYFEGFGEFFDWWNDECADKFSDKPEYCLGTDAIPFKIDATDIVERACEDMYEDAFSRVSNIDELQKLIDKWADKNKPGDAYVYHTRFKIRIPWERNNDNGQ